MRCARTFDQENDHGFEAARAALCTGMAERSLRHDDRTNSTDRVDERLGHGGTHEFVVGSQKRVHTDLIQRRDERIHVDDGNPCVNHPFNRRHEGVDLDGLSGDEIPFARRHLLYRGQLLCRGESGRPRDVHVEQFSPEITP